MFYSFFPSLASIAYFAAEPPGSAGAAVNLRLPASAHNEIIGTAAAQGLLGMGVYVWALAVVVRAAPRSRLMPALAACLSFHLANPASPATSLLFWLIAVIITTGPKPGGSRSVRGFIPVVLALPAVLLAASLATGLRLGEVQAHRREAGRLAFLGRTPELTAHLERWSGFAAGVHPRQAHEDAVLWRKLGGGDKAEFLWKSAIRANPRNIFYRSALADYYVEKGRQTRDRRMPERAEAMIREMMASSPAVLSLYDDLADALASQGRSREAAALRAERRRLDIKGLFEQAPSR
jgi:tetratricopeptide (TPR) repeat protein